MGILGLLFFIAIICISIFADKIEKGEIRSRRQHKLKPFKDVENEAFGSIKQKAPIELYKLPPDGIVRLTTGKGIAYDDFLWTANSYDDEYPHKIVYRKKGQGKEDCLLTEAEFDEFVDKVSRLSEMHNCFTVFVGGYSWKPRVFNMTRFCCSKVASDCSWLLIFHGDNNELRYAIEIVNPEHDDLWIKCATRKDGEQFATLPGNRYPCRRGKIIGMENFVEKRDWDLGNGCELYFRVPSDNINKMIAHCVLSPGEERDFDNSVAVRIKNGEITHFAETLAKNAVDQICNN